MEVNAERVVSFQQYGALYDVKPNEIPTYFFHENNFFKGYLEIYFDAESELQGKYSIPNNGCLYKIITNPSIVDKEKLKRQYCFALDLTKVTGKKMENIIFRAVPQFNMNIDPFSIRIYLQYQTSTGGSAYSPLIPSSETMSPFSGPWEFTINANQNLGSVVTVMFFGNDEIKANLGKPVYVNYPREVKFTDKEGNAFLTLDYENATVIDPKTGQLPFVTVSKANIKLANMDGNVKIAQFLVEEQNLDRYNLEETRNFFTTKPIESGRKYIDPTTVSCVYSFPDSNYTIFTQDDTTRMFESDAGYKIFCKQIVQEPKYLISVIGKQIDYDEIPLGRPMPINSKKTIQTLSSPTLYLKFPEKTSGMISTYKVSADDFPTAKVAKTIQQPLKLVSYSQIILKDAMFPEGIPKTIRIGVEEMLPEKSDPYSFRVFLYNWDTDTFELAFADVPSIGRIDFDLDVEKFMKSGRNLIFATAYYSQEDEQLGNIVYVNYPRIAKFKPTPLVSLEMSFEMMEFETFAYSNRPYFTLNSYVPDATLLKDWVVIDSVMQQNGNGLETYSFDETRTYSIPFEYDKKDEQGNIIPFQYVDLRCVYLFRETNFKLAEISTAVSTKNVYQKTVSVSCEEDIRDESFVFMLAAKKFTPLIQPQSFNDLNEMSPSVWGRYNMSELSLPQDSFTISFNPNSGAYGSYSVSLDKREYGDYSLPKMETQELKMIGVLILDFTEITLSKSITRLDTTAMLQYDKKTILFNMDPFSYKFFSVNDEKKQLDWMNCDELPSDKNWNSVLDFTTVKQFKIAIFGNLNQVGQFSQFYSLHYARSLTYNIAKNQMTFMFTSKLFPQLVSNTRFALQDRTSTLDGYRVIQSVSVIQSIRNDIETRRIFTINNSKDKILDLNSLRCVFVASGKTIFGNSVVGSGTSTSTVECSDFVEYELYDWLIVEQAQPIPIPSPEPSLKPPTPEPTIKPPTPTPTPIPSLKPPTPVPTLSLKPPVPVPTPLPTIKPPTPTPTPVPSLKPPTPMPTIKPPIPIPTKPQPKPTIKPPTPLPTKPQPMQTVKPKQSNKPVSSIVSKEERSEVLSLSVVVGFLSCIIIILIVSLVGYVVYTKSQIRKLKEGRTSFLGSEMHYFTNNL